MPTGQLTPLQQRVAREIIAYARRENLETGYHFTKLSLAQKIGISHNPVEAALAHLARIGVMTHAPDRGYFLARPAGELGKLAQQFYRAGDDPLYFKIVDYRLTHRLPNIVNEADLIRLFRTSRGAVRKALSRIQQEGWAERRPGHGWAFLPVIDSHEAYEECFEIRRAIEPAALISARFRPDPQALAALKHQQEFMVKSGCRSMSPIEWADINACFHETLAAWSHNRFFVQTIRRVNQLRRLAEYKANSRASAPRKAQAEEHVAILVAVECADYIGAAALMRSHLESARREKATAVLFR
jgi:DNA-binding GntR family transcriptional regulator